MYRVVGGLKILEEMEKVRTDDMDRPIEDIIIYKTDVLQNPYEEVDEMIKRDLEIEKKKEQLEVFYNITFITFIV